MKQLTALLFLALFASATQAGALIGIKSGNMPVRGTATDPHNVSLILGYEVGVGLGDVGVEGEFSRTTTDGNTPAGESVEVETNALYATFRSAGPIYLIAKGGVVSGDIFVAGKSTDSDFDTTYGIGVGLSLNRLQIELEFTQLNDDVDYVSLGFRF